MGSFGRPGRRLCHRDRHIVLRQPQDVRNRTGEQCPNASGPSFEEHPTTRSHHAWARFAANFSHFRETKAPAESPRLEPALLHNELASLENEIHHPSGVSSAKASPIYSLASAPDTIIERAPITSVPLLVSELPQGHFAHPVVSEPNLVGELKLKALIGADGRVKQVTVLSGNPKLAAVGMRAVRQWRYAPYQVLGSPVEVETQIKMNFFGEDAISVASVATVPPPSSGVASVPSPHDQPLSSKPNN